MPLVFLLIFGGVLLFYMGYKNESLKGILQDTLDPISTPTSSQTDLAGTVTPLGTPAGPVITPSIVPGTTSPHGILGALFPDVVANAIGIRRHDQGRDLQVTPNTDVRAPGNGTVVRNGYDPNGFGISYPIVHWTSGPWAGLDTYFGHIKSTVQPGQQVTVGQQIGLTQNGTGPYVGNASGLPGWIEIGLAPSGSPGPFGQTLPPGL